jgi:hypothetical protein
MVGGGRHRPAFINRCCSALNAICAPLKVSAPYRAFWLAQRILDREHHAACHTSPSSSNQPQRSQEACDDLASDRLS